MAGTARRSGTQFCGSRQCRQVVISEAAESDLAELLRVDTKSAAGDADRVDYITRAIGRDLVLVAAEEGAVVAFLVMKRRTF